MADFIIAFFFIIFTIGVYLGAKKLYEKVTAPWTIPVIVGAFVIISFLLIFDIPYETYAIGGQWIEKLLGPAVVALAYPLYNQLALLKKYFIPIIAGVSLGAVIGLLSGYFFAKLFHVDDVYVFSLLPKSVTTPVAMAISDTLGGIPPLAAIFVMVAGISGVVLKSYMYRWCKMKTSLGRGIAIGSASHALGTASALENSEEEAAFSSVAMILSAVIVSVLAPIFLLL